MAKNFYELEDVLSIPIEEVCASFGIQVYRGNMCKIRDEKTPSCHLYTNNSDGFDTFYDYGINVGGNVINLAMFIAENRGLTNAGDERSLRQWAFDYLGSTFNLTPRNNTEHEYSNEVSDYEYSKIGICGDLATKNLDFDLERFSMESAQKYSDKYHMSVNELRTTYPRFYTAKILYGKAIPFVNRLRNDYYSTLFNHYYLSKSLGVSPAGSMTASFLKEAEGLRKTIQDAERILRKAAVGTGLEASMKMRKYDVHKDFRDIIAGNLSFQLDGTVSFSQIKYDAKRHGSDIDLYQLSLDDYVELNKYLSDISYAAKVKGTEITLAFLPEYRQDIEKSVQILNTKREVEAAAKEAAETLKTPDEKPRSVAGHGMEL